MLVSQFLDWIDGASLSRRIEAADALVRAYLYSDTDEETRDGLEAAMTVLLDDHAAEVRAVLANGLAIHPRAPLHVVLALCQEPGEICDEILRLSPLLVETDLVDIVGTSDKRKQVAIAERIILTRGVAAALSEVGEPEAVISLLDNPGADIPSFSLRRIAERLGTNAAVRDALMVRPRLPVSVQHMLIMFQTSETRALLDPTKPVAYEKFAQKKQDEKDRATIQLAQRSNAAELLELVTHLKSSDQLTSALMLRALCYGVLPFFETSLHVLTGVRIDRISMIMRERHENSVAAICQKAGLPDIVVPAVISALDTYAELERRNEVTAYRFAKRMVDQILARFDTLSHGEAGDLLKLLRRYAADSARDAAREYAGSLRVAA